MSEPASTICEHCIGLKESLLRTYEVQVRQIKCTMAEKKSKKNFDLLTVESVLNASYDASQEWNPGYTTDNLETEMEYRDKPLKKERGSEYAWVHRTHPVLPLLVAASGYNLDEISYVYYGRWYKVKKEVFQAAVQRVIREHGE